MALISDYGLLGDCHGAALVSRHGAIDWWCPARFDAPSVFGRLLDPDAGHWSIEPAGDYTVERRYLPGSMVLETEFSVETGTLRLTDALALGSGERGHQIGRNSPHVLIRRLEVLSGHVDVAVELVPRPEYGLITPRFTATDTGIEIAGGADRLTLTGDRELEIVDSRAVARFAMREGDRTTYALHHRHGIDPPQPPLGVALVERDPSGLRRRLPGAGAPQCPGASGVDVPADRGRDRRRDDVTARGARRNGELGLPVRMAA